MIDIAIVTVTYNAEQEIEKTLYSVLIQDYEFLHYYIIDGKSTDDTAFIIAKYEYLFSGRKKDFHFICQKDYGIFDAMNSGIDQVDAEYVLFLNSGDYLADKSTISHVASYLADRKCDICYGDYYAYNRNKRKKYISREAQKLPGEMVTTHQAIFTKVDLLKKCKYNTDYKMAADYDFYLKAFLDHKVFQHIPEVIVYFQVSGVSQKKAWITQNEVVEIKRQRLGLDERAVRKLKSKVPFVCLKKKIIAHLPNCIRYIQYENIR